MNPVTSTIQSRGAAMSDTTVPLLRDGGRAGATRLVQTIGTIKGVLVALTALAELVFLLAFLQSFNGSASYFLMVTVALAVNGALIWVVLGWFQHTLSVLVQIAGNTDREVTKPDTPVAA
jgi:hypothetical protein